MNIRQGIAVFDCLFIQFSQICNPSRLSTSSSRVLEATPKGLLKVQSLLALTIHLSDLVNSPSGLDSMVSLGIYNGIPPGTRSIFISNTSVSPY